MERWSRCCSRCYSLTGWFPYRTQPPSCCQRSAESDLRGLVDRRSKPLSITRGGRMGSPGRVDLYLILSLSRKVGLLILCLCGVSVLVVAFAFRRLMIPNQPLRPAFRVGLITAHRASRFRPSASCRGPAGPRTLPNVSS